MTTDTAELRKQVFEAIDRIEPILRDQRDVTERERSLPEATIQTVSSAGLYSLFTPRAYGGLEVTPMLAFDVLERLSMIDSAVAWNLAHSLQALPWLARLPVASVREVYSHDPNVPLAMATNSGMTAHAVADGYIMSGQWPITSGARQAAWILGVATGVDATGETEVVDGAPQSVLVVVPRDDVEVLDTWDGVGMRGAGSHDVALDDVHVPSERSWVIEPFAPPNGECNATLYKVPAYTLMGPLQVSVALGTACSALEELVSLSRTKTSELSRGCLQSHIGEARAHIEAAQCYVQAHLQRVWSEVEAGIDRRTEVRADSARVAAFGMQAAARAAQLVRREAGMEAVRPGPIERAIRDIGVLTQHPYSSEARYQSSGQAQLGILPDFRWLSI